MDLAAEDGKVLWNRDIWVSGRTLMLGVNTAVLRGELLSAPAWPRTGGTCVPIERYHSRDVIPGTEAFRHGDAGCSGRALSCAAPP